ncbi:hypothetical protein [Streptomyces sp. NPDC048473]|uniref:hypothetical protein n=1 Tax=unclassified Streptomyces TaxID=2593676 RepID=UPI003716CD90
MLLLARTQDGWWDELRSEADTSEELAAPDRTESAHADAVRDAAHDYAAALTALGEPCPPLDEDFRNGLSAEAHLPGALQTSVLAGLLGLTGRAEELLVGRELAYLRGSSDEYKLGLSAEVVASAAATALLCGAADEEAALAALGHINALEDPALRIRVAEWLRDLYPPAASEQAPYWSELLPDSPAEELIATVVTPRFLLGTLMETTEEQDRRALTVLARAAHTRPQVWERLTELLSLLPGVSPMAVDVALSGGYPAPLADALTSLAEKNPALPADLLDAVPAGVTVFGEFPVLLAESLVGAY